EGIDGEALVGDRAVGDDALLGIVIAQGPDAASDIVAIDVRALQVRQARAAIDQASGQRLADVVVVFPDRVDQVLARAHTFDAERVQPLAQVPAVVAALFYDVDFLV